MNRVCVVGRLVRDPEKATTSGGKDVANFTIAVDRFGKKDEADFFRCNAWGKTADFVGQYLGKGRLVAVEGRLQQRSYTTSDGQKREIVEIVADNVQGLDRPKDGGKPKDDNWYQQDDPFGED